jgi:hypothetical protein
MRVKPQMLPKETEKIAETLGENEHEKEIAGLFFSREIRRIRWCRGRSSAASDAGSACASYGR